MRTMLGVFTDRQDVSNAIEALRDKGFNPKDISIVMKDTREAQEVQDDTGTNVAGGAVSGVTTGAIIGGLAGLLAAFAIPGLGAFFIGGPIAASLGLTGAAASTVSGAATGALAGGFLGALMGFGLSENEAKHYESRVKEGAILVAVPVDRSNESYARDVLEDFNASDIKAFSQTEEAVSTHRSDREYADMPSERDIDDSDVRVDYDRDIDKEAASAYTSAGAKGGKTKKAKKRDVRHERTPQRNERADDVDSSDELP